MSQHSEHQDKKFEIVEASIADIRAALDAKEITAVELAAQCLLRIARYDSILNAVPLLNPQMFDEAHASDQRRASGKTNGPLDGVPYTVKDSYKVKGMTLANGSPALQHLVANEDAFVVSKLKEGGAVMIGRTNMPPMAAGGMQRGVYGRAENPYNPKYLAAAFASGSSNGSAVSTAASFAAFGLGSETVSSGRSPASNNGLVAYTPSKGYISIRGVWPLYPTCDDLVPHTRSVDDMLELLDVISKEDPITTGDFWRDQTFVQLPKSEKPSQFAKLPTASLSGLRIAVPSCYIGGPQLAHSLPVHTAPEVVDVWKQARSDLEALGAEVVVVENFPVVQIYENPECAAALGRFDLPRLPDGWNAVERGSLIARTWNDFLLHNADPSISSLNAVEADRLFPAVAPDHPQIAYSERTNAIHYSKLKDYLAEATQKHSGDGSLIYTTPNLSEACRTLEALRKALFEDWLATSGFDMVVFPAAGDVGKGDADVVHESGKYAWTNGVKYSNGNRAMRHLGIPSVTVPMGVIPGKNVPIGLTFCGPAYSDPEILARAKAFEVMRNRRTVPKLTPSFSTSNLQHLQTQGPNPHLSIEVCQASENLNGRMSVEIHGLLTHEERSEATKPHVEIFIDSQLVPASEIRIAEQHEDSENQGGRHLVSSFSCVFTTSKPKIWMGYEKTEAKVARHQNMVLVLGRTINESKGLKSRPAGWYELI